ncbi:TPA: GNAT family N-acetyltransferase [Candidatus Micrarchaeota archaeon]|nr:GNAT family N-acetyltransferase [Candidatus Micrarchaeota archaeon]
MKFILKDGRIINIVPFNPQIPASEFLRFINRLIDEDIYIMHNTRYVLSQEIKWKRDKLAAIKKNNCVGLAALYGRRVIASLEARREPGNLSDNVSCGVAIAKGFRGFGLGEKMLRMLISLAKEKLHPKNIYLTVIADNTPAIALYKKVGFTKIIGRYPNWFKHKGKYIDSLTLLLVEK